MSDSGDRIVPYNPDYGSGRIELDTEVAASCCMASSMLLCLPVIASGIGFLLGGFGGLLVGGAIGILVTAMAIFYLSVSMTTEGDCE